MGFFFDEPANSWRDDAACKGMDTNLFHVYMRPGRRGGEPDFPAEAVDACNRRPVAEPCLDAALAFERTSGLRIVGYWGGKTPAERAQILDATGGRTHELSVRSHRAGLVNRARQAGVAPTVLADAYGVNVRAIHRMPRCQEVGNG